MLQIPPQYSVTYYQRDYMQEGNLFLGTFDTEALALGAIDQITDNDAYWFNIYIHPRNFSVRGWKGASKLGVRAKDSNITYWQVSAYHDSDGFAIPPKVMPVSYRGSVIWSHLSHLTYAIAHEGDTEKLIKLHEELNGYLFAVLYEQMGDMSLLEEELTRIKNPSILDVLNDVESYIMKTNGIEDDDTNGY